MDNYRTIEQKLANREPFRGNSLWAYTTENGVYRVVSYSTTIASFIPSEASDVWVGESGAWVSSDKYSTTTSRHQNLIRKAWGVN